MEQLPKDVLENILRRLSVYDIIRAGCACKTLRALVISCTFTSCNAPVSLLLLPHHDSQLGSASAPLHSPYASARAYDADRDAWLALSLAFLQPNLPEFTYPIASDGGLVCFGSGRDFLVCNPITKSWRRIPHLSPTVQEFDEGSLQAFGLRCNTSSGTYDFFLLIHCASEPQSISRLMNFSSPSLQWKVMRPLSMPDNCKLHSNAIISCNSRLYTLWQRGKSLQIFAFDNGIWSEIEVPDCTSLLLKAFLIDVSGSLYMVGAVGAVWLRTRFWERPTAFRIWNLHAQSNAWTEVTRMPSSILHEYYQHIDFDELQCWGKNGVMYMKSLLSDVLMFELSTNQWKWLKDVEMDIESLGLLFEPSLSAVA